MRQRLLLGTDTLAAVVSMVVIFCAQALVVAGDWPGWRGPTGQGICTDKDLPTKWSANDGVNIRWKAPLVDGIEKFRADLDQSSPVIFGELVFVTVSYWPAIITQKEFPEHHVVCFRKSDGKRLWDTRVSPGPWLLSDLRGGYTCPTPAVDAERVYVVFGSSVIAALDHKGVVVWRKEIKPYAFDVAIGASPVLFENSVLMVCDMNKDSRLIAYDCKSGEVNWEEKRPRNGFAHSTPVLVQINGKPQLLVAASNAVQGVNPTNGKVLWWCDAKGDTVSPVFGAGLVFCDSGRGGSGVAVDPTGEGDLSKSHLKWKIPSIPEGFSSPVIVDGCLYRLHSPGVLKCWKMDTGDKVYSERLEGLSNTASSPIVSPEGRIYFVSGGKSFVIQAGPTLKVLATNDLGDPGNASPAVSDGCIYVKGSKNLYCIGSK